MNTYKITVLEAGEMIMDHSILVRGNGYGEKVTVPARVVAVEGAGVKLLVNTGLSDGAKERQQIEGIDIVQTGGKLSQALDQIGWKKEEVTAVVNTSLHFTCCGNNSEFSNAKLYVQKKEWDYAHAPSQNQIEYYDPLLLSNGAGAGVNLTLVDGEYTIDRGLVLIPTPGCTRGHQSLLVNTEEGVVCIAGEAVNMMENLKEHIIGNILDDTRSAFQSMRTISRTSGFIVPAYDPQIPAFAGNGFPETHEG